MRRLYTIGYEGATIADFIETLVSAGVRTLADVRDITVSRKKGFSKNALRTLLAEAGINYIHFRQLGDPKPGRIAARLGDMAAFKIIYSEHIALPAAELALRELAAVARKNLTCLMCYEREPQDCHRRIIANHLDFYNLDSFDLFVDKRDLYGGFPEKLRSDRSRESITTTQQQPL